MIEFTNINDFKIESSKQLANWIEFCIHQENKILGEINYIFCSDDYLIDKNIKILKHNTLTDIISIDYGVGNIISGDIFISTERIEENAKKLKISFINELHRVMVHGILHYCGYKDKNEKDIRLMREKEDYYLSLRTF